MKLRSLGRKTDLIFARFGGEIVDRGDYIAVKTPSNPDYHWGNFIIFNTPPQAGDLKRWTEIYRSEFDFYATINHMTLTWDSPDSGHYGEFIEAGFQFDRAKVLTTRKVVPPPKLNRDIEVRPLANDQEWKAAIELQVLCRDLRFDEDDYRIFKRRQMSMYKKMSQSRLGDWFGAFLNQKLVGDLGIFFDGSIGRFQNVGTHPDFLRQGICGTLVFHAAQNAFQNFGIETLVMEADADYHAARIYESVGFIPTETNHSLSWSIHC